MATYKVKVVICVLAKVLEFKAFFCWKYKKGGKEKMLQRGVFKNTVRGNYWKLQVTVNTNL